MCVHGHPARTQTHTPPEDVHTMGLLSRSCLLLLMMVAVLLVPAALAQNTCTNTDPCVLSCEGCTLEDKVPDPENCHRYYVCLNNTEEGYYESPLDCSGDDVFNITNHECGEGDCTVCTTEPTGPTCIYECSVATATDEEGNKIIPSTTDCGSYYICDADATEVVGSAPCDDALNPFFDGTACQADETQCCHCQAYCYAGDSIGRIADPQDCRRYYLCTTDSEVTTNSASCPEGQYFDSTLGDCSDTATCSMQPECTNVLGLDGCIDPFTCEATGYFAKCQGQCTADYYHCTAATGEYQDAETCDSGVFHPDSHTCVEPDDCP